MVERTVSVIELAASLTDVLDRARRGESFVVERDGERVARIAPPSGPLGITLREIIDRVGDLEMPGDGFADDLEAVHAAQGHATLPEWPD